MTKLIFALLLLSGLLVGSEPKAVAFQKNTNESFLSCAGRTEHSESNPEPSKRFINSPVHVLPGEVNSNDIDGLYTHFLKEKYDSKAWGRCWWYKSMAEAEQSVQGYRREYRSYPTKETNWEPSKSN